MGDSAGKWIIAGIFGLALLAAGSSWWYRYSQTRQAAQFWGGAQAESILKAERVELLTLQKTPAAGDSVITLDDDTGLWYVAGAVDVAEAHGMLNARNALVHDASLRFGVPPGDPPQWQYALRFHGPTEVTVLFDLGAARAKALGRPGVVGVEPIAGGLQTLFREAADHPPPKS